MGITTIKLKLSQEVGATTEVADEYTPPSGAEVWIETFYGDAAFTPNSKVGLTWKYNHGTESEVSIWTTKGSANIPLNEEITGADGVRKLALTLDNGEAGAVYMSGMVCVRVKT